MQNTQAPLSFIKKYYLDDLSEINSSESKFYLSWLKYIKGKSILNLGCGPSFYNDILFFKEIPKEVVGIDFNKNNINFLKKSTNPELLKYKNCTIKNNIKTKLLIGDIREFRKEFINHFDVVYAIGVLGMFKRNEIKDILKKVYIYLKPNGIFLDVDWADCKLPKEKYKERLNYNWYSNKGPGVRRIRDLIKKSKFKIIKNKMYNVKNPKKYFWGKIYAYVAKKS